MDTVTLVRSAIRQLLDVVDATLEAELRAVLARDDDYASGGKPTCDWDDAAAREALVHALAKDAYACLGVLDGAELGPGVAQAAELLATVVGQDVETGDDGIFRIARKVAKDRVISVVDPDARHGHFSGDAGVSRGVLGSGCDGHSGHTLCVWCATCVTVSHIEDCVEVAACRGDRHAELLDGGRRHLVAGSRC